jgi:hypothetical protein
LPRECLLPPWAIFIIAAQKGAQARQVTTYPGADNAPDDFGGGSPPAFSPDGKLIAYWQGGDPKLIEYATNKLAVVPVSGDSPGLPFGERRLRLRKDGGTVSFSSCASRSSGMARNNCAPVSSGRLRSGSVPRHSIVPHDFMERALW